MANGNPLEDDEVPMAFDMALIMWYNTKVSGGGTQACGVVRAERGYCKVVGRLDLGR